MNIYEASGTSSEVHFISASIMYLDVVNEEVFFQMKTKLSCIPVLDDMTVSLVFI